MTFLSSALYVVPGQNTDHMSIIIRSSLGSEWNSCHLHACVQLILYVLPLGMLILVSEKVTGVPCQCRTIWLHRAQ
jgi:hypothetical protein